MNQYAKTLMFLGTGSDVGKSVLTAAFCRILKQDGYRVAPFKAQNMALNSFITPEGGEMGRAQVVQAEAAGIAPHVDMNPILLKPTSQMGSQVIVQGRAVGNFSAREYYEYKKELIPIVRESFERLARQYQVIVLEGAGSAVELNLKEHDLVNLAMADMADAPCILVGDIDRGGIFAALLGSYMLMNSREQDRIMGFMINKLRGDPGLLLDGVRIIESHAKRPVLGVIPYFEHIALQEEDSVALKRRMEQAARRGGDNRLNLGVVRFPFISNYTDFDCFEQEPGVLLSYFDRPDRVFSFDAIILPGSKNTLEDLSFLQRTGLGDAIVAYRKCGGTIVGICGGYQMLGSRVKDPHGVESTLSAVSGLGLLDMETEMFPEKVTSQVEALLATGSAPARDAREQAPDTPTVAGKIHRAPHEKDRSFTLGHDDKRLYGYEIHMGRSVSDGASRPLFRIICRDGRPADIPDGLIASDGKVWGTYIHGIFDNDEFRRRFLRDLHRDTGKAMDPGPAAFSYRFWKEEQYDLLAAHVRQHADIKRIYHLMGLR